MRICPMCDSEISTKTQKCTGCGAIYPPEPTEDIEKQENRPDLVIVNTDYITDKNLLTLGLVKGSIVQTKHIGSDLVAGLKSIVGGELTGYTKLMDEARNLAIERMEDEAITMGADGIVGVRFISSEIMDGAAEVIAYGTAVKFQPNGQMESNVID